MSNILPAFYAVRPMVEPRDLSQNSTAPVVPPKEFHGLLGDWAVVCHGLNLCSVVCCCIVLISSTIFVIKNRNLLTRPSLRLSTAIAVCDLIYSVSQLVVFNNAYMSTLSEIRVRAMLWIMAAASVTFVMLSSCMGIQLLLTVLTRKSRYAYMIQPYYEVASFFIGFFVTHPYMYLFTKIAWLPTAQSFHIRAPMHVFFRNLWLIQWVWITMGVIFLFFIALFTYLKMSQVWQVTRDVYRAPEKLDLIDDETISSMTEERKRYIRSVTLRVTFYPLIPVITQIWLVANSMMLLPPYWLFVMCYLMPSAQGILNFLVYTMNPALDIYRKAFVAWITGRREKQEKEYGRINHHQSASELHDDNAFKSVRSKMSVETNV